MRALLHSQIYRLSRDIVFWGSIILTVVSVCFYAIAVNNREEIIASGLTLIDYFSIIFQNYSVGLPLLVFSTVYISEDFAKGTVHNYIAKGIPRACYYLTKLYVCIFAAIIFLIVAIVTGAFVSQILWGNLAQIANINILQLLSYFLSQILLHVSYSSLIVFLCFLFRNPTISTLSNFFLLIFGYPMLHKIELSIFGNYVLSMFWPVALFSKVQVLTVYDWFLPVAFVFVVYVLLLTYTGVQLFKSRDIR